MVAYFDYRYGDHPFEQEIQDAIRRVLASGRLVLGPEVAAFEREFAGWLELPEAVGCGSGTDALVLALRALGIGPGDEVITVANAGVPPVAAIRAVGAVPRFVDVEPDTLLLDPAGLAQALRPRTRCVLPVHLYGLPAAMDAVLDFAASHGLAVVEDCAQAHGARYRAAPVGGFGAIGCFSFYPTKNLGAYGDGGICVTRDPELAERLRMLRMYGFRDDRHSHCEGLLSRLDELQAAILRVKLRHLDDALDARGQIARHYLRGLEGSGFGLLVEPPERHHAYHLFVVRAPDRARVAAGLERAGIGFGIHYPEPVHRMEAYRSLDFAAESLPVTERASEDVLSLPLYPGLAPDAVELVIRTLRESA